ncbi:hypothetical protein [Nocardia sp. NPDC050175]|uniref:hypothetical protein n=1 Tax=Nocardia sp. NPDC050175 TaxID=3364317 RepID=UPI00379FE98C
MTAPSLGEGTYLVETNYVGNDGNEPSKPYNGELTIDSDGAVKADILDWNAHGCGGISTLMYSPFYVELSGTVDLDDGPRFDVRIIEHERTDDGTNTERLAATVVLRHDEDSGLFTGGDDAGNIFTLKVTTRCFE